VLSRALRFEGARPLAPAAPALLAALAVQQPNCAIYAVARAGRVFLGASPETLLALEGSQVLVDALAGTAWQKQPLDTDKNRREHDQVARAVVAALADACESVEPPAAPETMQLNGLAHLRRRIRARRGQATAFDLIARLHPTPAVGGAPRTAALDWLARHGELRPAWYTGGIGWIDAEGDCDVAVALRCGQLVDTGASLWAGAGFVSGSDPHMELTETDAKFTAMRAALAAAQAGAAGRAA